MWDDVEVPLQGLGVVWHPPPQPQPHQPGHQQPVPRVPLCLRLRNDAEERGGLGSEWRMAAKSTKTLLLQNACRCILLGCFDGQRMHPELN